MSAQSCLLSKKGTFPQLYSWCYSKIQGLLKNIMSFVKNSPTHLYPVYTLDMVRLLIILLLIFWYKHIEIWFCCFSISIGGIKLKSSRGRVVFGKIWVYLVHLFMAVENLRRVIIFHCSCSTLKVSIILFHQFWWIQWKIYISTPVLANIIT